MFYLRREILAHHQNHNGEENEKQAMHIVARVPRFPSIDNPEVKYMIYCTIVSV